MTNNPVPQPPTLRERRSNNTKPADAGFFTTKNKGNRMDDLDRDEQKEIVKEAIREWLDERYSEFGKWTLHGLLAACLAALAYYLALHGGLK